MQRSRAAAAALLSMLAACSDSEPETANLAVPAGAPGSAGTPLAGPGTAGTPGTVYEHRRAGPNESKQFIVDPNQGGRAGELRLAEWAYGRLVHVYALVGNGRRRFQQRDFLVDPGLVSDGVDYLLETHPATGEEELVILRDVRDDAPGGGYEQFLDLLKLAEANLVPLNDNGLPGGAPPWSQWPRNGAVVLRFDDLLDGDTITAQNVRTLVGAPPVVPFEARLVADTNHGDFALPAGEPYRRFFTTRVIVDPTVGELEAFDQDPPLPVNPFGLPPSMTVEEATVSLRLATQVHLPTGQDSILTNLAGNGLAQAQNGTIDFGSPTVDLVRAARAGGPTDQTGDPQNGFLPDTTPPRVVGSIAVDLLLAPVPDPNGGAADFILPEIAFPSAACAETPAPGAAFVQPGFVAVVTKVGAGHVGATARRVFVHLRQGDPAQWPNVAMGPALYRTPWDPVANAGQEGCYLSITPLASGYPAAPTTGVDPKGLFRLSFSEPVNAGDGAATDALHLLRTAPDQVGSGYDRIVADSVPNGREWHLLPVLPLSHQIGNAESYWIAGPDGHDGPVDLAGNPLLDPLPAIELTIEPAAATERTGGHVTTFSDFDEDPPFGGLPEWSGQHLYDLAREEVRPRPVVHFETVVDRNQPVPKIMTPFATGVPNPLNPRGAKAQLLWRYADMGFLLDNPMLYNLDAEGLAWAPVGGQVIVDSYQAFEIRLAHANHAPDEYIDPASLFPKFPNSGLKKVYDANYLDPAVDPPSIVHDRSLGYSVNPGDIYVAPGGTKLMPWPWNEGVPPAEQTTYTWRDTSLRPRGGKKSGGSPLWQEFVALGQNQPSNRVYPPGEIRTEGLPLLMEFRCWPDVGALGLNAFDVSLAANSSSKPYFRAFSAGGIDANFNQVLVDPDLETEANGGFDPNGNPPGSKTFGLDNVHHLGSVDFVVRVSRSHSIWFEARDPLAGGTMGAPGYLPAVLEPAPDQQPAGTALEVHYRGMASYSPPDDSCGGVANHFDPLENALTLDLFGDHYDDNCLAGDLKDHGLARQNPGITFLNGVDDWQANPAAIDGAVYHQVRVTFLSNPVTGLTPVLTTLGTAWSE